MGGHAPALRLAAKGMAVHQGSGFPRDDYSQGVRRQGLFGVDALVGDCEADVTQRHRRGVGDGAQLIGAGGVAAALRHPDAERLLPAATGQGFGNALLRTDQP